MTGDRRPATATDPDLDGVFSLHPEVVSAVFDDRVLLHHLNRGETYTLNRTAGLILELMDGERSTAEIRQLLREAYPEAADDVERDVVRTLRYLIERGALDASENLMQTR